MPIYIITFEEITLDSPTLLVDAQNKAQAINYAARKLFTVETANGHDIARLVSAGVELETVTKGGV